MQIKKTGRLFSFCCLAPILIIGQKSEIRRFNNIGENIGLLFQIADDLLDYRGKTKAVGKKTKKDSVKGKATLISILGYKNAVKYAQKLKTNIFKKLKKYDNRSSDLKDTVEFILKRKK